MTSHASGALVGQDVVTSWLWAGRRANIFAIFTVWTKTSFTSCKALLIFLHFMGPGRDLLSLRGKGTPARLITSQIPMLFTPRRWEMTWCSLIGQFYKTWVANRPGGGEGEGRGRGGGAGVRRGVRESQWWGGVKINNSVCAFNSLLPTEWLCIN